jgi:anthranilate phosphoribosyltransferase
VSSRCGSADVLEELGVRLDLDPQHLARLHDDVGVTFLFAPRLHPAMGAVMPVRGTLGVRTVFNLLGPLTNPAGVRRQVIGVWGADVQPLMAEALAELGAVHALVVHSDDGLDEISVFAPTTLIEVIDGKVEGRHRLDPSTLGVVADERDSLAGGTVAENAARLRTILAGGEVSAASDAVAVNAGAALVVAGVAEDLESGFGQAREVLASGAAAAVLERLSAGSMESASDG